MATIQSLKRPGIYPVETPFNDVAQTNSRVAVAAFIGTHHQGFTDPTMIDSWSKFVTVFGGFPSTGTPSELPYAVYNYFANGGRAAWVMRVVGTSAVKAYKTLTDNAATPQSTLKLTAVSEGTWGNSLYAKAVDRDATNGRFDIVLYKGGTTDAYVVEKFLDLSMVITDSRYAVNVINSATAGSQYVTATNMSSATAAPDNRPITASAQVFASGADGGTVTETTIQNALSGLDDVQGPFLLSIPGNSASATINAALAYAEGRGDVFVLCDTASALDASSAVSAADAYTASSYGAVYWPWVKMADPTAGGTGSTRLCPPGPMVAGLIVQTDTARGVFKAPAGIQTRIVGAVGLETKLTDSDLDTANVGHVNAIKSIPGSGICVYGARTLKKTGIDKYVSARRSLIFLKQSLIDATAFAVFEPNDERLWASVATRCINVLNEFWLSGGLKGNTAAQAYFVKCDAENNPPNSVASGEVHVDVGVAIQAPAEFVVISIGQFEGGAAAAETV